MKPIDRIEFHPYAQGYHNIQTIITLFSATNCSILSCGENAECVQVNDIFQCACKDDYEGPDCELGEAIYFLTKKLPFFVPSIKHIAIRFRCKYKGNILG